MQIAVTRPLDAAVTLPYQRPAAVGADDLGYKPASKEQPFGQNISAILISPPQAPVKTHWTPPSGVLMPGQAPGHHQPSGMGCRRVAAMR